jgi:MFS family permease
VATLLVLGYAVLYIQAGVTLPLAIKDAGLSAGIYGFVIAINGVVIVIGQPLSLTLLERWPRSRTLPIGIALAGAGLAATGCAIVLGSSGSPSWCGRSARSQLRDRFRRARTPISLRR